ncbi:aminodeoxychorismate synthase component I [soil metagenome]
MGESGIPIGQPLNNIRARFDDLGRGGHSFELTEPRAEFIARQPHEVVAVLRAAEQAARDGMWVAGFVTYEAAAGFDASLPVLEWPGNHPLATLPLAWFASFARRQECAPCQSSCDDDKFEWQLRSGESWHRRAVTHIRESIRAGDYYQLNLTTRLSSTVIDPEELYPRLATAQRGAHNALIVNGEHAVLSASPELFFSRIGNRVVTRPMKGTAGRGRWPHEDQRMARALRASAKERAENVMIVDLLRNDLARLATGGSVSVSSLFEVERFPTVWQMTSTIETQLAPDNDLATAFAALFPCGSVTGAPKRAAMAGIAEIEQIPRGVYCGAIGYLSPDQLRPAARFAVAIRTVTIATASGYAEYGAGGAITWSSNPKSEWAEVLTKTAVLRSAPRPRQLIETVRFEPPATVVNLSGHLARLAASAEYFDFEYQPVAVREAVEVALRHRATLAQVQIRLSPEGHIHVEVDDLLRAPSPSTVGLADRPVDSDDVLLFHQHADRGHYDQLRRTRPHLDDVLLWNENREITEATAANVAVYLHNRWWTPALRCGLLPGVERARLIAAGVLAERIITLDELGAAGGLALVSSLRGWRSARLATDSPPLGTVARIADRTVGFRRPMESR